MPRKSKGISKARNAKKSVAKIVKNTISRMTETKHNDHQVYVTTNQTLQQMKLTPIPQNITDTARIGDKISAVLMEVNLSVYQDLNCQFPTVGRIVFWQYKNIDTTAPTTNLIYEYGNTWDSALTSPFSMDRKPFVRILKDIIWQMPPQVVASSAATPYAPDRGYPEYSGRHSYLQPSSGNYKFIRFKKKINTTFKYIGGGTNGVNNIYMSYFSNVNTNAPLLSGWVRMHLKDY